MKMLYIGVLYYCLCDYVCDYHWAMHSERTVSFTTCNSSVRVTHQIPRRDFALLRLTLCHVLQTVFVKANYQFMMC